MAGRTRNTPVRTTPGPTSHADNFTSHATFKTSLHKLFTERWLIRLGHHVAVILEVLPLHLVFGLRNLTIEVHKLRYRLFLLLQIPLGREYLNAGASDTSYLQALSAVSV